MYNMLISNFIVVRIQGQLFVPKKRIYVTVHPLTPLMIYIFLSFAIALVYLVKNQSSYLFVEIVNISRYLFSREIDILY